MNKKFSIALFIALLSFSGSTMASAFCDAFFFPLPCPNEDPSSDPDDIVDDQLLTELIALDDENTVIKNTLTTAGGNVLSNDIGLLNFAQVTVRLESSPSSPLGNLIFNSDGSYSYQLFNDSPQVQALNQGEFITDVFSYSLTASSGENDSATLTINILGSSPSSTEEFAAIDDENTVVKNSLLEANGNVLANDKVGQGAATTLISSPSSVFGNLIFDSNGNYTYKLFNDATEVQELDRGEFIFDVFTYTVSDASGQAASADLTITVLGSSAIETDNVEIEINNRSNMATPLHQGQLIQGDLSSSRDIDWYSIPSEGNDIVHIEVCPIDSSCFGEKSWVAFVLDGDRLTLEMEETLIPLNVYIRETGEILSTTFSNNMYLAYESGVFDDALLGVIDPTFGDTNAVNIAAAPNPRTLFVAVVSPLERDDRGSVVLEEVIGTVVTVIENPDGSTTTSEVNTISQFIVAFPFSEDQYFLTVTGTGVPPLATRKANSAVFDPATGLLTIPEIRAGENILSAELLLQNAQTKNADSAMSLVVDTLTPLDLELTGDPYQSTYNPANNRVFIPQVVDTSTNKIYSVTMQYHAGENGSAGWLEVLKVEEVI